jgi:hypothetical protein
LTPTLINSTASRALRPRSGDTDACDARPSNLNFTDTIAFDLVALDGTSKPSSRIGWE